MIDDQQKSFYSTFPIMAENLEFFLPHRKPMRWVDCVTSLSKPGFGTTQTQLQAGELYMGDDEIKASSLIEIIAQSYGYLKAVEVSKDQQSLSVASLAAIDQFEVYVEQLPKIGSVIVTELKTLSAMHPLYLVEGTIFSNEQKICKANLKCFALLRGEQWENSWAK